MDGEIPARVVVVGPLPGVSLAVQRGRDGLLAPTVASAARLQFDFSLRLGKPLADGRPNFLGDYAHGTPAQRFVYVNAGKLAGQADSCWERRAKLMLDGVTQAQVDALVAGSGKVLQASFVGTGRDGGPACARISLHDGGWQVVSC